MTRMQAIAATITPGVFAGTRGSKKGTGAFGRGAGGFIPNYTTGVGVGSEQADINRGVGGAPRSAKPVTIPNFNFGAGQKGTMVANTSEFMVPNFAGTGGTAIFNQDMVDSLGLPAGAKRVGAAGGFIPNFVKKPIVTDVAGMIVPQRGVGKRRATGNFGGNSFSFPVFGIDAAAEKVREEKDIKKSVEKFSIGLATRESKSMTGGRPTAGKINRLANQGAIGGLSGAIFETALSSLLKSKDFDFGETATFDYVGASAIKNIGDISPMLKASAVKFLDAKIAENAGTRNSMAKKIFTFFGASAKGGGIKGRGITELMKASGKNQKEVLGRLGMTRIKGAGGYIPSFAGPLQEAVARETAAGLPINQVRINQDASLRNSANPMGLAITNTRDEPTGAIPNFAKKATPDQATDVMGGFVGKLLAVQIGFSALSGILGEVTNQNKALSTGLTALNLAVSAALAAQAFGGFKNIGFAALGGGRLGAAGQNLLSAGRKNIITGNVRQGMLGGLEGRGQIAVGRTQRGLGRAAGAAGPLITATIAAVGIGAAFNALTKKTEALGKSQERVADSASKAASVLGGLQADEDAKDRFVDSRAGAGADIASRFLKGTLTTGLFSEGKEFNNLSTAIDTALQRGATESEINKLLDELKAASKDGLFNFKIDLFGDDKFSGPRILGGEGTSTVDSKELSELSKTISRLGEADLGKRFKEITEGLTKEQRQGLISGDAATIAQVTKQTGEGGKTQLSEDAIKLLGADLKALEAARDKTAEKEKQKAIDQVNTSLAQDELKTQINLIKLKAEAISQDQIALKRNEFLNNLSEIQKQQIEQRIALKAIETETDEKIADIIVEQIDSMEKLTLDSDKQKELKKELSKLSLDELSSQEKVKEILGNIFDLDGKITGEQDALLAGINKVTDGLRAEEQLRKNNLKLSTDVGIADAGRAQALRSAISGARRSILDNARARDFDRGGRLAQIQLERGRLDPNLTPQARARAETGFVAREGAINVQAAEDKAVADTKESILKLSEEIKDSKIKEQFDGIGEALDMFGPDALEGVRRLLVDIANTSLLDTDTGPVGPNQGRITQDQKDKLKDEANEIKQGERDIKIAKRQKDVNNELAKSQERVADGFKSYSILLRDFAISLRQQAEQLKVDLVKARDGASILSNINEQLFTASARGGGAGAIAQASTDAALTGLRDQAFLAGSARESRGFTRQIDIVREQLQLKKEFVELQKDEIVNEPKLIALKKRILQLEKERLQVNETLGAKFKDEFILSDREIQNRFNDSLVSSARTFADTLSEGLTNAIAKGESLGDTLKQAAADFFLEQSKNNFKTALNKGLQIFGFNAGGKVTGGSGARDDVPALLTGGEFVMNKKAVDKYGANFMSSLNQGSIPTMNRGGLFTPGTFGQGAMKGKRNLLDFATQSFTTGAFDRISGGSGFASIALEPQSAALTMFGRRNSPQFAREQASKQKAFGLFTRQVEKEKEFKESQTSLGDALLGAVKSFAISNVVKGLVSRAANAASFGTVDKDGIGRAIPLNEDGTEMNFLQRMMLPVPKKATGGAIPYAAGVDTVPAMLSGGEFVMNAAATQRVGRGTLSSINSGGGAGNNGAVVAKLDELISVSENNGETTINVTVNSDGTSDQSGDGNETQSNLALKIRDVVKQVIDDEKRLGGSLREVRA